MTDYHYSFFLAVDQSGDPKENVTFDLYDAPTGGNLVPVRDLNGTTLAHLVSNANGIGPSFIATIDQGYLRSGTITLPILSMEAQNGAAAAAQATTAAAAAQAAATSAAAVTSDLEGSIVAAVQGSPTLLASIKGGKGDPGPGPYTDWLAQGNTGNYDAFAAATLTGPTGDTGPTVTSYTPPWDLTLTAGYVTPMVRVPTAAALGIKVTALQVNLDQTTTTAAKVQLVKKVGGTVTNLLTTGSEATVPPGSSEVYLPLTGVTVPAGAQLGAKVVTPPSTGAGASTPDDSIVATTSYGDAVTTTGNTHTLAVPPGGASGDVVLVLVPEASNNTTVKMADARFTEVERVTVATLSGLVFAADWAPDLSCTINLFDPADGITPVNRTAVAVAVLKRGSSSSSQQADLAGSTGPARTGPAVTQAGATAFGLAVDYYRMPGDVVASMTPTGGPSGSAVLRAAQSAHATLVNVGINVRTVPGVAAGGTYAPTTYTLAQSGGAGSVASTIQVSGYLAFQKGAAVAGVARMTAFVEFERV